jgi:fluoride ion exporter CrcB/FEX
MERIGNKVSYIRKPPAKYSFVSVGLIVAAYVFGIAAVALSYQNMGDAPMNAAAFGLCSIVTTISSIVYGVFSFFEKEKNYLLAKVCLVFAGSAMCFWLVVVVAAQYIIN